MTSSTEHPKNNKNGKQTMVNVFFNEDPYDKFSLANLKYFEHETIKALIHDKSLSSIHNIFEQEEYKDRIKFNVFKNLKSKKLTEVLKHSRKYVYRGLDKSNYDIQSGTSQQDENSNAEIENMFQQKPDEEDDIHANVYIFVGALTYGHHKSRGFNDIPSIVLAPDEIYPIYKGIFDLFRAKGCKENIFKNKKPKLLLFIFLSTRDDPCIGFDLLRHTGLHSLLNFEAWEIYSKSANLDHGYSSVEAFSGIQNKDLTQTTLDLWKSLYGKHLSKAAFQCHQHVGYTYNSQLVYDNRGISDDEKYLYWKQNTMSV